MAIEIMLEIISIFIAGGLLVYFVPKRKLREAIVSILFMQSLTWILGGLVVELRLVTYPVRILHYAFKTSFTFEFIVFPSVSAIFNLYFPKSGTDIRKLLYSLSFPSLITIGEVIIEKFTRSIEYLKWNWFYSWSSMWITLLIAYLFYRWFFKKYHRIKYKPGNFNV